MINAEAYYEHRRMMDMENPSARLLREKRAKARKTHECSACHQTINPGETFLVQIWLNEDVTPNKIETYRECAVCLGRDWSAE